MLDASNVKVSFINVFIEVYTIYIIYWFLTILFFYYQFLMECALYIHIGGSRG